METVLPSCFPKNQTEEPSPCPEMEESYGTGAVFYRIYILQLPWLGMGIDLLHDKGEKLGGQGLPFRADMPYLRIFDCDNINGIQRCSEVVRSLISFMGSVPFMRFCQRSHGIYDILGP